jgi:hypothetical protein
MSATIIIKMEPHIEFNKLCRTGDQTKIQEFIINHPTINLDFGLNGAAKGGHTELVKWLIDQGATGVDWALQGACQSGNIELVHLLIDTYGATKWDRGLSGACKGGHLGIMYEMLVRGATDYEAALGGACAGGHVDIADYMMTKRGAKDYNYGAYCAAQDQQMATLKLMIEKGADRFGELYAVAKEQNNQQLMDYLINDLGYQVPPPPPLVADCLDDRKRILGLIQLRSPGYCMGLQMGGEVQDHMYDCLLVGLKKEKMDALKQIVDKYMMERHAALTDPGAYRTDLELYWWDKIFGYE